MEAGIPLLHPNCLWLCEKRLTATDINSRIAFPVAQMDAVWRPNQPLENPKTLEAVDKLGHTWDLVARLRWDARGNPKPEVYGPGWRRFVADKELKVGDRLVFYHNPDLAGGPETRFLVTVKRLTGRFKLFGEQIHTFAEEE